MQTFFNPTTPFFDDEGHPLVGARVSFLEIGTSANFIDLTDSEGTPLPNPLFTGSDGRLRLNNGNGAPAVPCIANGLSYKVVVAKKTGVEPIFVDGILQNPEELYEEPSIVFVVTAMGGSGAGGNSSVVGSIAEVRSADKGLGSVVCAGYYAAGDCPSRTFTWFDSEEPPEDNGINILRNPDDNTGYWKMGDPQAGTWDVRMAGLRPEFESSTNSSLLANLLSMVNDSGFDTMSTRIFFPKGVWKIQQGFTAYSKVVFGYGAKLSMGNGTAKTFNFHGGIESFGSPDAGNLKIFEAPYGGYLKIVCGLGVFRSSWLGNVPLSNLSVKDTFIIDSDDRDFPHTGARMVIVETDLAHIVDFRDCEIVSAGHLGNGSFRNCKLRGAMFLDSDLDSVFVDEDCVIHAKDFHGRMPLWCKLRSQQHDPVLDLEMETLDSSCTIALDGVFFKDALFNGFVHDATASVGFEGCRGSIVINALGNFAMTSEDSELNITFNGTGEAGVGFQPALNLHDGTISFVNSLTYLLALGGSGTALTGNAVLVNGDVALDNVNIGIPITLRGALDMRFCTMNSNMLHYTVNQIAQVRIEHSILNAFYSLTPAVSGTTVRGVWSHNYSSVNSPIVLDRTNLDPIDSHHDYVYSNNSGGFLPYRTPRQIHEITIHHVSWAAQWLTTPYTLIQTTLGNTASSGEYCWFGKMIPHYDMQHHFDTVEMFRLGVDRFRINARLTDVGSTLLNSGSDYEYAMNVPVEAGLGGYFVSGNQFCIRPWFDDPTAEQENLAYTGVSPVIMKGSRSFGGSESPSFTDYHVYMGIEYECMDKHG